MAHTHMKKMQHRHHKERQAMHTKHEKERKDMDKRHMEEMGGDTSDMSGDEEMQGG